MMKINIDKRVSVALKVFGGLSCAVFAALGLQTPGNRSIFETMCIIGTGYSAATLLKSAGDDYKSLAKNSEGDDA